MIITYLRSSLVSSFEMCPWKGFLEYVVGLKAPSGRSADLGNVVHKAIEILALGKLTEQNGGDRFFEEETGVDFICPISTEVAFEVSWSHHVKTRPHHEWSPADRAFCRVNLDRALTFNSGQFDPRQREVIWPEKYFDLEIPYDWARYSYKVGDESWEGQLRIKGTMDLVCGYNGSVEYLDWKTGRPFFDWVKNRTKTYQDLTRDFQLNLYGYALSRLLPKVNSFLLTIVYTQEGWSTIPYGREDVPKTEAMIRSYFEKCQQKPLKRIGRHCGYCNFGPSDTGSCEGNHSEMVQLGVDRFLTVRANLGALEAYSGGGRQVR